MQCFGSGSVRNRIIWPDPCQTIRIRVAPKTFQNHEKKIVLKNTIYTKKKNCEFKYLLLYNFNAQKYFIAQKYLERFQPKLAVAKHLIGKTRFKE